MTPLEYRLSRRWPLDYQGKWRLEIGRSRMSVHRRCSSEPTVSRILEKLGRENAHFRRWLSRGVGSYQYLAAIQSQWILWWDRI